VLVDPDDDPVVSAFRRSGPAKEPATATDNHSLGARPCLNLEPASFAVFEVGVESHPAGLLLRLNRRGSYDDT